MPVDLVGREYKDFPEPEKITSHGPAIIVAMCNQKGGVGKTTTTINIASALANYGRKVLVVDFDPQSAATAGFGQNPYEQNPSVYNLLVDPEVTVKETIVHTKNENLDLLPSNIDLSAAEVQIISEVARENILSSKLVDIKNDYDVILIDCQPSLGLLTINALTAANSVVIPLTPEYFALRGVALLTNTIKKVKQRLNPKLELSATIMTMVDLRTLHSKEIAQRLLEAFNDKLMHTYIARSIKFSDATVKAESIIDFAPEHKGAKAYKDLAKEMIFDRIFP